MKQQIKVWGYYQRGICNKVSHNFEHKYYIVDVSNDGELQKWFHTLCNEPRTEFSFVPCILCVIPKRNKETDLMKPWK